MLRVGLTGGIAAGKSEVSRRLEAQGAIIIDADAIAREVVAPGTPGLEQVTTAFGRDILRPDGALDRERLGELVFADPAKLAQLNGVVHPLVGKRMTELEATADADAIVVHDVPLIAENGLAPAYDVVVVVDTRPTLQLERLVKLRGMSEEQARARIAAQASREQRLAIADFVIDNSGSLSELARQVGDLWAELRRRLRPTQTRRASRRRPRAHSRASA